MKKSKDKWKYELNNLILKYPWKYNKWLKPRLIFLPNVFPTYYPRTYLNLILVGEGMKDCPDYVRKYVVAHEYGHIYHLHTLLFLVFLVGASGLLVGMCLGNSWLLIISFLVYSVSVVIFTYDRSALKKELEADGFSVDKNGVDVTIAGQEWMTDKTNSKHFPGRIERMRHLMKYKENKKENKEYVDHTKSQHTQSQIS
jgi:hypothetical protein